VAKNFKKCKPVPKSLYFSRDYADIKQFISWFYQINTVQKLNGSKMLEVGVGNKILSNYLKQQGLHVTTADFDKNLHPDYVCDVRKLPFNSNSFDVVCGFEILEHIPFSDFQIALKELKRVTKKYGLFPSHIHAFHLKS
jgi:ubiquinone/menaquinone biosynthesis C-methylase UbiE